MSRLVFNFNNDFLFSNSNYTDAEKTDFDDSNWQQVNLPHDWSIYGDFERLADTRAVGGYRPSGIGWYRKRFTVAEEYRGKFIELEFGGIHRMPTVYLNGEKIAFWINGYITKRIDISKHLNYGGENTIAVKVDNTAQPASRYYTGCGIYRDVNIIVRDCINIKNLHPFITTPCISAGKATVKIQTELENKSDAARNVIIKYTILNKQGVSVAKATTNEITLPLDNTVLNYQSFEIDKPNLWCIETPYLYKLKTEIICDGNVVDEDSTNFGIRSIRFDKEQGFFLNDKRVYLKGVCLHHDNGAIGAAENIAADRRRLQLMKDMGVNAIRLSHNPFAESFLNLCDEMGLLVMDEFFDEWKVPKQVIFKITDVEVYERKPGRIYSEFFDDCWEEDMVSTIIRDRNHPSIIMYSIGNEIYEQRLCMPGVEKTSDMLAKKVKEYDTTRPVTAACCFDNKEKTVAMCDTLDIVGYNYADVLFNPHHEEFPNRLMLGSETVSISSFLKRSVYDLSVLGEMNRYVERTVGECFDQRAARICSGETSMRNHMGPSHVAGVFIWTGIDYLGEPTPHPWPSRSSYFGAADTCCFPKDAFYYYKSIWGNEPVIHILPHWNLDIDIGSMVDVIAYTNCHKAELFINGNSVGISTYAHDRFDHIHWKLPYEKGELKAVGYDENGRVVATDIVCTAEKPDRLVLSVDRNAIFSGGRDTAFITAKLVDKNGNVVPNDSKTIKFSVDDGLQLIGVDNGDQEYTGNLKADSIPTLGGLALAIVSSKTDIGDFYVTATVDGLSSEKICINVISKDEQCLSL